MASSEKAAAESKDYTIPVVDAHFHVYDPLTHPKIDESQRFFIEELEAAARRLNLVGSVHMQLSWEQPRTLYESVRNTELARKNDKDMPNGLVVFAPMEKGAAFFEKVLQKHIEIAGDRVRGTRQLFFYTSKFHRFTDDPEFLRSKNFLESFAVLEKYGLTWDAGCYAWQIPFVAELARKFPRTKIVLNHFGTPYGVDDASADGYTKEIHSLEGDKAAREFRLWKVRIAKLAECPNVYCKISGLAIDNCLATRPYYDNLEDDWTKLVPLWKPYIEHAVGVFGADRCMWASNFPVDGALGISYIDNWRAYKTAFDELRFSKADQRAIFAGTATEFYGLGKAKTLP